MTKGRLLLTAAAGLCAACLLAPKTWAQPAQKDQPMRQGPKEDGPCKADVEKFCKDVKHGEGRIMKCLKEHDAELSEACKKSGEKMKERMAKAQEACKADVEKFCKDVKPGGGAVMKCLREHDAELSDSCKAIRAKAKEKMAGMREKRKEKMQEKMGDGKKEMPAEAGTK
jgi:hypothetical protein